MVKCEQYSPRIKSSYEDHQQEHGDTENVCYQRCNRMQLLVQKLLSFCSVSAKLISELKNK